MCPYCEEFYRISCYANRSTGKKTFSLFNFTRHYNTKHKKSASIENSGEATACTSGTAGVVASMVIGNTNQCNDCTDLMEQLAQVVNQNDDLKKMMKQQCEL